MSTKSFYQQTSFIEQMERRQKMREKTLQAAELVWNNNNSSKTNAQKNSKPSGDGEEKDEDERELDRYIRWTHCGKWKKRKMFFAFFRRSLNLQKARHWCRYPSIAWHCPFKIILCWFLFCCSAILNFRFLFKEHQNWRLKNLAIIIFVSVHSVAIFGLWTKIAIFVAFIAVLYTLFTIVGFFCLFYKFLWMIIACQTVTKIPREFPVLLPVLGWTSKLLWETFVIFRWKAKWKKEGGTTLDDKGNANNIIMLFESSDFRPRKVKMHDYHQSLIKRAKAVDKGKCRESVKLFRGKGAARRGYVLVFMPKSKVKLRRRGQQQQQQQQHQLVVVTKKKSEEEQQSDVKLYDELYAKFVAYEKHSRAIGEKCVGAENNSDEQQQFLLSAETEEEPTTVEHGKQIDDALLFDNEICSSGSKTEEN
ncbi:hypothetical protein niasHS_000949 [Heterodera schachtii]|uniref:Uncharacterized protein n=1 Tax=Heterodera schachtii TaxID=97005 RepID=A0ABD2K7W4_HETSC